MEKKEFGFSALQPVFFIVWWPGIYFWFTRSISIYALTHSWLAIFITIVLIVLTWKNLRITLLMLRNVPAVILTDKSVTITQKNDTIYWEDVKDVYMTNSGTGGGTGGRGLGGIRIRYVTIMVREPEKYIMAIKNPFVRYYRWYTRNWKYSPFEINLFLVKGDDDEIYQEVLKYYQHNRLYFRIQ